MASEGTTSYDYLFKVSDPCWVNGSDADASKGGVNWRFWRWEIVSVAFAVLDKTRY